MGEAYFQPWIGERFTSTRLLIMSESTYTWEGENGDLLTPQPAHPGDSIKWNAQNFGANQYFTRLNQALCRKIAPTPLSIQDAWADCAYTVFVQEPVGSGPGQRPNPEQWRAAGEHFMALLESLRPHKVVVTGRSMWNSMPECSARLLDDLQAYEISDRRLVWCLAVPHPANRTEGFRWDKVGESISWFRASIFPTDARGDH